MIDINDYNDIILGGFDDGEYHDSKSTQQNRRKAASSSGAAGFLFGGLCAANPAGYLHWDIYN